MTCCALVLWFSLIAAGFPSMVERPTFLRPTFPSDCIHALWNEMFPLNLLPLLVRGICTLDLQCSPAMS